MRIVQSLPTTNFERPNAEQLRALARIAFAAFPRIEPCSEREFERAFLAVGHLWRLPAPDRTRYFHLHVSAAADVLRRLGLDDIEVPGNSVLAACISHGDVPIRFADRGVGQSLEVGLSALSCAPCRTPNRWKAILSGAPLLSSVPPSNMTLDRDDRGEPLPRPKVFEQDGAGVMREVEMRDGFIR